MKKADSDNDMNEIEATFKRKGRRLSDSGAGDEVD